MGSGKISQIENWVWQQAGSSTDSLQKWYLSGVKGRDEEEVLQFWKPHKEVSFNGGRHPVLSLRLHLMLHSESCEEWRSWRTKWVSISHSLHNCTCTVLNTPVKLINESFCNQPQKQAAAAAEHSLYLNWSLLTSQQKSVKYRIRSFRPTRVIPGSISKGSSCPVFGRNRGWKQEQVTDARRSKITADQTLVPTDV
jgi:hypothetical protein